MPMDPANQYTYYHIYFPTWNATNQAVEYIDCIAESIEGNNVGDGGVTSTLMLLSAINKLNPAWHGTAPEVVGSPVNVSGEGVISAQGVFAVRVFITKYPANMSRFWQAAQLAKYGVIMFVDEYAFDIMPVNFVNSPGSRVEYHGTSKTIGLHYCFPPGVTATLIPLKHGAGSSDAVPSVRYYRTAGELWWDPVSPSDWAVPVP